MPRLHKRTALAEWRHQVREMRRRTQALSRDRPYGLRLRSLRESHLPAQRDCVCAEQYFTQDVFYVMYLMASTGCGITAKRIQRETGVTYKTAWRMIRHLQPLIVKQPQPAHSIIGIDTPNVLRIRQNHGLATAPQPESDSFPAHLDKTCIVLNR